MPIEVIKISKIHVNTSNPRQIKDDSFKKLVKSLKDFPEMMNIRPIVCNKDMMILGGNMRYEAAKAAGWKEIPVNIVELSEEKQREFIIKDNVSGGEWDWDILLKEWDTCQIEEWGLDVPKNFRLQNNVEEDNYEIQDGIKTDIVLGDLFQIGKHRLLCGDSTKKQDVDKLIESKKADLIFTDPPYDLEDSYSQYIFDSAKDDCHIFIMNSDRLLVENVNNGIKWFRKFFAVDFRLARLVSNNQPMTRIDLIAEFCKGKTKFNNLYDGFSTLIECAKIHNNNEEVNYGHKQAKRIELPATFINHYSVEKELVFDFFGGSGTTMAACEQLNRICYMMEFTPENCQRIINRMEKIYNLKAIKI